MEGSDGSPPPSLCIIRAAESYPKPQMEKEDTHLSVPFQELAGESVKYLGRTDDGVLALSNYRIFLLKNSTNSETSVPLGLIETVQARDLFHLIVNCKDASTVKCSFETAEQCSEWQRRIQLSVGVPESIESLFAFPFYSWTCDALNNGGAAVGGGGGTNGDSTLNGFTVDNPLTYGVCSINDYSERLQRAPNNEDDFKNEVERLGFDLNGSWRISTANADFKLCASYPQMILVPCCITDETLHNVANFRGSRRLPAVVWRHQKSGAVIARCSQPEVGWLGWRNYKDEQLLKAVADACAFDRGEQMRSLMQQQQQQQQQPQPHTSTTITSNGIETQLSSTPTSTTQTQANTSGQCSPSSGDSSHEEVALDEVRKVLIVDARSYTSAVTNRARGGGCECIEYYPCAEIEFMNLGNIHVIRKSFHALRQLYASSPDIPTWLSQLEKTMWLQHLSGLMTAAMTVCHAIEKKGRPVLVHCSDGWDRTPQIVATAQLCLDPHYRTVEGFRVLVEREWLSFGHKFADRCGHGPSSDELNERCPVFLQWLDLVHQIHKQFPCSFEFSMGYLIKLAQHSLSCLFGNFLCNSLKERLDNSIFDRTFSVWPFLSGPMYRNPLYVPNKEKVLWPSSNVRDLYLWSEVYLGSLGNKNCLDFPSCNIDAALNGSLNPMAKTRSYGDLINAGFTPNGISRRSSDPNMAVEPNLTICSNSENNSIADIQSDLEDSPDLMANLIHDTTRKVQNLTTELNNHHEHNFKFQQQPLFNGEDNVDETISNLGFNSTKSITKTSINMKHNNNMTNLQADYVKQQRCTSTSPHQQQQQHQQQHTLNHFNETGCELNSVNLKTMLQQPSTSPSPSQQTKQLSSHSPNKSPTDYDLYEPFTQEALINERSSNRWLDGVDDSKHNSSSGITIHKANDLNLDLMQSVDFDDSSCSPFSINNTTNGLNVDTHNTTEYEPNLWHGSVNTSTDTLVPNETKQQQQHQQQHREKTISYDDFVDGDHINMANDKNDCGERNQTIMSNSTDNQTTIATTTITNTILNQSINTNSSILPKIHSSSRQQTTSTANQLLNNSSSTTNVVSSKSNSDSLNSLQKIFDDNSEIAITAPTATTTEDNLYCQTQLLNSKVGVLKSSSNNNNRENNTKAPIRIAPPPPPQPPPPPVPTLQLNQIKHAPATTISTKVATGLVKLEIPITTTTPTTTTTNFYNNCSGGSSGGGGAMDESIFIQPEYQKLEISINGKCESVPAATTTAATTTINTITNGLHNINQVANGTAQRRRRTSSSNSRRDGFVQSTKHANGSTISRFSLPGVRSLPMTPPGQTERTQIALSCPDGLAHALSEQNIRLQQIVHEHKIREDVLLREIHDMRLALLRKICPNCNNASNATNDDQCSASENVENASICSWEAVEDRSGPPSSSTSSSIQPTNAASVLWVPDHAVSRCTSCQTEFWLGRRKHHCRCEH